MGEREDSTIHLESYMEEVYRDKCLILVAGSVLGAAGSALVAK